MSFLDRLRAQADALQQRERSEEEAFARNAQAVEVASRAVFHYGLELVNQLNVLRPPVPGRYVFDNRHALDGPGDGLRFDEFRIDARRRQQRGLELHDHIVLSSVVRSGRRLTLDKDFPNDMELLEGRLAQAGILAPRETVRDPDSGRFIAARYEFPAQVHVSVRVQPDHAGGGLQFTVANFGRLESVIVEFEADRVGPPLLDELAKWWLGESSRFLHDGRIVRTIDPR
jgi:hypothetical protein